MKNSTLVLIVGGLVLLALAGGGAATEVIMSDQRKLTAAQIYQLALSAGFTGYDLQTAVAIALAESGGDPGSLGDLNLGNSYGLWQINARWHPEFGPDFSALYDPQTNADAAFSVYKQAGNSFTPWSTYKGGQYVAFMEQAAQAAQA